MSRSVILSSVSKDWENEILLSKETTKLIRVIDTSQINNFHNLFLALSKRSSAILSRVGVLVYLFSALQLHGPTVGAALSREAQSTKSCAPLQTPREYSYKTKIIISINEMQPYHLESTS